MIGPEGATALLVAGLAAAIPDKLTALEERLDLAAGTLPAPKVVVPRDIPRLGLEDWPALMVVAQEARGFRRVDVDDEGATVYAVTYPVRVYEWARGDNLEQADLARKRLVLAVREVMLEGLVLDADVGYVVDVSLRESYADLVSDEEAGGIGAAFTEAELNLIEALTPRAPAIPVGNVGLDTAPLPPHPAL